MSASITVLALKHLDGDRPMKASCSVQLGGVTINDVKVIDAGKGPFVGMPSSKGKDGKWHDHVTLSKPLAEKVREIVLRAFRGEPPEGEETPRRSAHPGRQRQATRRDTAAYRPARRRVRPQTRRGHTVLTKPGAPERLPRSASRFPNPTARSA